MARKRSRIDIINDILATIQNKGGKIKQTHLMYKANLSHAQMRQYLDDLLQKNMIAETKEKSYNFVLLTERGYKVLNELHNMRKIEEAFGI